MTVPDERTKAVIYTREFLVSLLSPELSPRVPKEIRGRARSLLKHYPGAVDLESANRGAPDRWGKVPHADDAASLALLDEADIGLRQILSGQQISSTELDSILAPTAADERALRGADDKEWAAEVIVATVVPELEMAVARTADNEFEVHLWKDTKGLQGRVLKVGQHVIVRLKGVLAPEVLFAVAIYQIQE